MSPAEAPPFAEPWQARAFALAVTLSEQGVFTWSEWTERLGREIAGAPTGDEYWRAWVAALEHLVDERLHNSLSPRGRGVPSPPAG